MDNLKELKLQGYEYNILNTFPDFHISMLTRQFLNPATRNNEIKEMVLVMVKRKG